MTTDDSANNKREFSRAQIHVGTTVTVDGKTVSGSLRDVSMNGLFVLCKATGVAGGTHCTVDVVLSEEVHVSLAGHVVREEATGLAIAVEEIPVDSFRHLQQLVLYNADDPDQVEQELKEHIGIKRNPSIPVHR